ncbi:hypothetical protein BpHYR1_042930 [Brachionus plicatilis]|uniref:Uncharacterized protein n=1 Tax=Brachionus plicatilis TaxID=10195 RepID=A0A3M7SVL2_BRAPC|nr:hypothetical protein BpHYR1_042930 [Brachionus plicatilis]
MRIFKINLSDLSTELNFQWTARIQAGIVESLIKSFVLLKAISIDDFFCSSDIKRSQDTNFEHKCSLNYARPRMDFSSKPNEL